MIPEKEGDGRVPDCWGRTDGGVVRKDVNLLRDTEREVNFDGRL